MIDYAAVDDHIERNLDQTIGQLARLCAQPSVSAQGVGIAECAELVAQMLTERGYAAEIIPTAGHPIVFGEAAGRSARTLLCYLHYDVQPPEPLELWQSPPWQLTQRGDALYARGVSDDKGHIVARLAALDALTAVGGALPCRIKFVIEGEEEVGSPSIRPFIVQHRDRLRADACIWEFGGVTMQDQPTLALGLRGILFVHLSVRTANRDIHSGLGGSIFPNAAWRLIWALNSLKDANENILVPGFYDDVQEPTPRDLALLAALPDHAVEWRDMYDLSHFLRGLEGGLELRTAAVFEPSCNIAGLTAGYQGDGGKTIVPAEASAKLDLRLVPNQRPDDILRKLRRHLDAQGFGDVDVRVTGGYPPAKIDPDDPFVALTTQTAHEVYGVPAIVEPIVGGSGPMAWFVEQFAQMPIVTAGVGYPGGKVHAPNEHVKLTHLVNGIKHTARIIGRFATDAA